MNKDIQNELEGYDKATEGQHAQEDDSPRIDTQLVPVGEVRSHSVTTRRGILTLLASPLLVACAATAKGDEKNRILVPVLASTDSILSSRPLTGRETPFPPTSTPTPRPVNYLSFPEEVRPIVQRLAVPDGLYLYLSPTPFGRGGNCDGFYSTGNYNIQQKRVELYERWDRCQDHHQMLFGTTHEMGHSHQHQMIIDAGLSSRIGFQQNIPLLQPWLDTEEGKAFMAAGGRSNLPSNPAWEPTEDFANIFAAYYWRPNELRQDSRMWAFAESRFPRIS